MEKEIKMILAINPGSTSTKIAVFKNGEEFLKESFSHSVKELEKFDKVMEQKEFRTKIIKDFLKKNNLDVNNLDAVVGRGGLLKPLASGTYKVNQDMLNYLQKGIREHASNLGAAIAFDIAQEKDGLEAFIVDPVVVDEMDDIAKVTGFKDIKRKSIFHALNQKAAAREAANQLNINYEDGNFIVAHLGGGISIGAHKKGQVTDVNNALNGDGPFTPERAGTLPALNLIEYFISIDCNLDKIKKDLTGKGGVVSLLNTNNMIEVEDKAVQGDKNYELVLDAMGYNISKEIGSMATVLKGKVDAIVITGGIAYSKPLIKMIKERIDFLGKVIVLPGEDEMKALAQGALRVLSEKETAKAWKE